jgi:hypothetical protein
MLVPPGISFREWRHPIHFIYIHFWKCMPVSTWMCTELGPHSFTGLWWNFQHNFRGGSPCFLEGSVEHHGLHQGPLVACFGVGGKAWYVHHFPFEKVAWGRMVRMFSDRTIWNALVSDLSVPRCRVPRQSSLWNTVSKASSYQTYLWGGAHYTTATPWPSAGHICSWEAPLNNFQI